MIEMYREMDESAIIVGNFNSVLSRQILQAENQ